MLLDRQEVESENKMKLKEAKRKVCPWLSSIYEHEVNCLGTKCMWFKLTKRFGYPKESTEIEKVGLAELFIQNQVELSKKDWEYECGIIYKDAEMVN